MSTSGAGDHESFATSIRPIVEMVAGKPFSGEIIRLMPREQAMLGLLTLAGFQSRERQPIQIAHFNLGHYANGRPGELLPEIAPIQIGCEILKPGINIPPCEKYPNGYKRIPTIDESAVSILEVNELVPSIPLKKLDELFREYQVENNLVMPLIPDMSGPKPIAKWVRAKYRRTMGYTAKQMNEMNAYFRVFTVLDTIEV